MNRTESKQHVSSNTEARRACEDCERIGPVDVVTQKLNEIAAASGPVMDAGGQVYESKLAFADHHAVSVETVLRHCAFGEPKMLAGGAGTVRRGGGRLARGRRRESPRGRVRRVHRRDAHGWVPAR